jgi:hypothetical protein
MIRYKLVTILTREGVEVFAGDENVTMAAAMRNDEISTRVRGSSCKLLFYYSVLLFMNKCFAL